MNKGFTLIELLVVVLIIGILSAVALPQYTLAVERSRASEGLTLMSSLAQSLERYRSQKDAWPADFSKLDFEMPKNGDNSFGGKLFNVTFTSADNVATIIAARTTGKYSLKTTITDNASNGLFTRKRECTGDTDTCNAISGGKPGDF